MTMKNRKRILAALLVGAMALGLTACGSSNSASSTKDTGENSVKAESSASEEGTKDSSDYKTLRIGCGDSTNQNLTDLAYVAQSKGYLEEELNKVGYTAEISGFAGQGPEINAALMSNSLDAATYGDFAALTATGSGASVSVVAVTDPVLTFGILAGDDSIQKPSDLEGKRIVVQQGTMLHYFWEQFVDETGIDADSVEVINSNVVDAISLIQTGDTDAFVSAGYSIGYYAAQGIGHQLEGYDVTAGSSATYFVVNNSVLEESPEVAVAINKALIRAYNDVVAEPDIFYNLLGERYGVDSVKAAYGFDETLAYLTPEITDDVASNLSALYDWMSTNQLLASEFDAASILNRDYYQQAVDELAAEQ